MYGLPRSGDFLAGEADPIPIQNISSGTWAGVEFWSGPEVRRVATAKKRTRSPYREEDECLSSSFAEDVLGLSLNHHSC